MTEQMDGCKRKIQKTFGSGRSSHSATRLHVFQGQIVQAFVFDIRDGSVVGEQDGQERHKTGDKIGTAGATTAVPFVAGLSWTGLAGGHLQKVDDGKLLSVHIGQAKV